MGNGFAGRQCLCGSCDTGSLISGAEEVSHIDRSDRCSRLVCAAYYDGIIGESSICCVSGSILRSNPIPDFCQSIEGSGYAVSGYGNSALGSGISSRYKVVLA